MNPTNAVNEISFAAEKPVALTAHATRPWYWSVRREVWENKSLYVAPLAGGAVGVVGYLIGALRHPLQLVTLPMNSTATQSDLVSIPYSVVAALILVISVFTGVFYCLDALYGERRDRSILFWKSLPVSDMTTVLAKLSIPMMVLPGITFGAILATQIAMKWLGSLALLVRGVNPGTLWTQLPLASMTVVLVYGLVTLTLWHAPIYGYLLLVSAWAKRATLMWAVMPLFLIGVLERIAFHTAYFGRWIRYRVVGEFPSAFDLGRSGHSSLMKLSQLTPGRFLMDQSLWTGLIFATAMVFAVVRMRRYREPI